MMSSSPIDIEQLTKSYRGKPVLQDITLHVAPGTLFGLIGVNGAGKTTLIKLMLDLASPDSGTVHMFGVPHNQARVRMSLLYLPEKFQPPLQLKGSEFLRFTLAHYHVRYDPERAEAWAASLSLDPDMLQQSVRRYSKGMVQKLGLIAGLLSDVPLLILDEPMSGLDPLARIQLKEALKRYTSDGNTVFFSSHILADIEEICTDMALLHQGKLAYTGKPKEFLGPKRKNKTLEEAFLHTIEA